MIRFQKVISPLSVITIQKSQYRRACRLLEGVNPGLEILEMTSDRKLSRQVLRQPDGPVCSFLMEFMLFICLFSSGRNHIRIGGIAIKQNGESVFWYDSAGSSLFAYWNYAFICHSDIDSGWNAGTVVPKSLLFGEWRQH